MRILLHICCAPCAIEVIRDLRHTIGGEIVGFFYNPNIHPLSEYERRKECLQYYVKNFENMDVVYPEYDPRQFFDKVNIKESPPNRCIDCWQLRLEETAKLAKENGFSAFTTTLLISPYQSEEKLKEIAEALANKYNVEFIFRHFRKFYPQGRKIAKALGLYRQNYCGCLLSEWERFKKKEAGG
jgi:hypothetical protein